jgi:hypothetical protein
MSLTTLLRHVGVHVPRGVSVDGRIVLGVPAAGSAVTPLAAHTFHGGPDPESPRAQHSCCEPRGEYDTAWWNLDPVRLEADQGAVRSAFPSFQLNRDDGNYRWQGVLDTGRGRYRIDVTGNRAGGTPFIRPLQPRRLGRYEGARWRPSPHRYTSGGLCVAETTEWIPEQHTTATAIAWAAHWLAAYTDWRLGGPWPTAGYRPRAA